jgi:hypothetical protein
VDGDEYLLKASKHTATPPTTTKGNYFFILRLKQKGYQIFFEIFAI